ncbi:hypothetical protein EDB92DRAFT_1138712 [Lactarius akahatsu]|uniref:Uncharacterized protein n=1 Tax=Lactarius akahatsu TaxID=416441 RepID=A0AAD4QBL3_9AGAM|nr:hypothetical protein EDB92DRAFT_1138712 [Lactarius akahatsu]
MLFKGFLVLFLGLVLPSSIARAFPNPRVNDEKDFSFAAGKNNGGKNNCNDPQKSLTLDPKVVSKGFERDGRQGAPQGQVPSITSGNNFINFCLTVNKPLTDGKQKKTGSCNTCPMGEIPSTTNMPSSKFTSPENFGTIKAGTTFTIKMKIQNLESGNFVNAQSNYYAAPQQLNKAGNIRGHTHYVVQQIASFTSTDPLDPNTFAFFKGANNPADADGIISVAVDKGLQEGFYRLASINTSANHTPVLVPIAQHGFLDDMVYRDQRWQASRPISGWHPSRQEQE